MRGEHRSLLPRWAADHWAPKNLLLALCDKISQNRLNECRAPPIDFIGIAFYTLGCFEEWRGSSSSGITNFVAREFSGSETGFRSGILRGTQ